MNLKHNSPATKVTDTTNIFWVAAALCWQSAGCNYIGPTQTRPAFYWLQLHWGKYDILTEFRVCCSSVRMKQLQFLLSNNRGPEVFARKKTPTINCHQNDNYHDHHWDETLRTVPVASESIRFYISTYSARFTLMTSPAPLLQCCTLQADTAPHPAACSPRCRALGWFITWKIQTCKNVELSWQPHKEDHLIILLQLPGPP